MTCTDTATANEPGAGDASTARTKAVLFCPRCEYRAPWDGAWEVRTGPGRREVRCPSCGHRVA